MPITLVVLTSLQMGGFRITPLIFAVSEMGQYVADQYVDIPMVSLVPHNFVKLAEVNPYFAELPKVDILDDSINYMLEIYMYNNIAFVIPRSWARLHHIDNAVMTCIHDVFPLNKYNSKDVISLKKILKRRAYGKLLRNFWGFTLMVNQGAYHMDH